ncbi:tRNA/tmRNA/rRNA uracil-C5-methylase (TrmA/RlmC/RlmD family) [Pseudonocardia autotrophica]|uniref:23S rRNA methyltransferase n=3 Tax=Pseudonocardiaceae TaxID=2070 RepID=A0ABQ0RXL7_9PSEU|nr:MULTISPECIES: class I SAM-dependent RNA methyltransferase [Pseudonocardia]OSY38277.1 putative RNA methyltransferase/cg2084 [Pseudonocardia autotrophica]TDN70997.1 tRNA/tmRNA/rRNA uracil-C5-methylase (TrmA/RlmC/RlmD family) [Pseudonocardia autotrophica]BBG01665.1 23S rRNA methyltransferase [Pseudonocardia autotrophica]GEC25410.1 23S rRNA methyltransferase [Pseudonocardia saturnea]
MTDWTDRMLELLVGPVAHGGHFVARAAEDGTPGVDGDGRVVFVRHALPGERVRAVVTEDPGGAFCRADTVAVLDPSPDRVEPPCPWAGPGGCGGCDFQHASAPAQRDLKTAVLREQLERLAGPAAELSTVPLHEVVVEELPGGPLGWRTRARLAVDDAGVPGLRAHRSHDVCEIADCSLVPAGALEPVLEQRFAPRTELEVTVGADGAARVGAGATVRAAGRTWELSPGTFWQVHPALADTLAGVVGDWADAPAGGVGWDLYGGVGLLGSVLAGQVGPDGRVLVVESSRSAVRDGRAALADLPQVSFVPGRAEREIARLSPSPDVVVSDPPRAGLGAATVRALADRAPRRVVHVACDPAALGRDLALFAGVGYRVRALRGFDAFPMTHHMEAAVLLERLG